MKGMNNMGDILQSLLTPWMVRSIR